MAEERSRVLEIEYLNANEDSFSLDIPDYSTEKSDVELKSAAENILTQAAFEPNGFPLTELVRMTKVITTEEAVDLSGV